MMLMCFLSFYNFLSRSNFLSSSCSSSAFFYSFAQLCLYKSWIMWLKWSIRNANNIHGCSFQSWCEIVFHTICVRCYFCSIIKCCERVTDSWEATPGTFLTSCTSCNLFREKILKWDYILNEKLLITIRVVMGLCIWDVCNIGKMSELSEGTILYVFRC